LRISNPNITHSKQRRIALQGKNPKDVFLIGILKGTYEWKDDGILGEGVEWIMEVEGVSRMGWM
jgi:hypothetical protein